MSIINFILALFGFELKTVRPLVSSNNVIVEDLVFITKAESHLDSWEIYDKWENTQWTDFKNNWGSNYQLYLN